MGKDDFNIEREYDELSRSIKNHQEKFDIAYISGFFDGEGYITISKRNSGKRSFGSLSVGLDNTDIKVLEWIQKKFNGNVRKKSKDRSELSNKKCYAYNVTSWDAKNLLEKILPFLRIKHDQAKIAIKYQNTIHKQSESFYKLSDDIKRERAELYRLLMIAKGKCKTVTQ